MASVVQRLDSTIHHINLYPVDSAISFPITYPVDSAIQRYFEQPGPDSIIPYSIADSILLSSVWGPGYLEAFPSSAQFSIFV